MFNRRVCRVALAAVLLAISAGSQAEAQAAQPPQSGARPQAPPQVAQPAPATSAPPPPLFRVILRDGTALVSYGEFTRVGDRVVFSMPLDSPRGERLQLVNLPASVVNWDSTDQYAAATRYAQYVASRAESDYAVLTGQVASALNEIALAKDPARRLQIAEQARRLLAAWPAEHLGYRSADVNDMLSLLGSTISELRGDAADAPVRLRPGGQHRAALDAAPAGPDADAGDRTGAARRPAVRRAGRTHHAAAIGHQRNRREGRAAAEELGASDARVGPGHRSTPNWPSSGDTRSSRARRWSGRRRPPPLPTCAGSRRRCRRCRPAIARSAAGGRTRSTASWPCSRRSWIRPGASGCFATSGPARRRRFARTRTTCAARSTSSRSSGRSSRTSSRSRAPPSRLCPILMQSFERIGRQLALIKPPDDLVLGARDAAVGRRTRAAGDARARACRRAG